MGRNIMELDYIVGGGVALILLIYLLYVLVHAEKF
jgi:K+-transporting ATPase KdpF subunit